MGQNVIGEHIHFVFIIYFRRCVECLGWITEFNHHSTLLREVVRSPSYK